MVGHISAKDGLENLLTHRLPLWNVQPRCNVRRRVAQDLVELHGRLKSEVVKRRLKLQ